MLNARVPVQPNDIGGVRLADNPTVTVYDESGDLAAAPIPARSRRFGVLFWHRVAEGLEPTGYRIVRDLAEWNAAPRDDGCIHFPVEAM